MKVLWLGLEAALDMSGMTVKSMSRSTFNIEEVIAFNPDFVFEREFNAEGYDWVDQIKLMRMTLPKTTKYAVWLIDSHVRPDFHKEYSKLFDYAFCAISSFIPELDHPNKYWLPLCHTAPFVPEFREQRDFSIGFVGRFDQIHLENRTEFMNKVKLVYPDFHAVVDYANVYQTMSSMKIMVNLSYNGDMNFRTFESLACGNILVTSEVPDLYKIEGLVERIHIYKDFAQFQEIVNDQINREPPNYQAWIMEKHLMKHRLASAINMMTIGIQSNF